MQLKQTGTQWNRNTRNDINDNWDTIANNFNGAVQETIDEAKEQVIDELVDNAKLTWVPAVENYEDIDTTYPNPEEGWTVNVSSEGNVYRYDGTDWVQIQSIDPGPYNELSSQLADTVSDFNKTLDIRSYEYDKKPLFTFQFDDAQITDYTRFKDIFESEGVPGSACVITSNVGTDDSVWMNEAQLKELKELGWGIYSHTHTHPRLGDITDESELDYELKTSQDILRNMGMDTEILVYPYGSHSDLAVQVARKYYQYAIDISRYKQNYPPHIDNMLISRVRGLSSNATLEECKQEVDDAFETGNWVIFTDHSQYEFYDDPSNLDLLRELIQYIKTKNGEIVTTLEGARRKANIVDVGGNRDHVRITRDGKLVSPSSAYSMYTALTGISSEDPISYYEPGRVTELRLRNDQASDGGFPESIGGILITHRHTLDTYSYQMYHIYNSTRIYKRRWNNASGEWEPFTRVDSVWRVSADNEFDATSPLSSFNQDQVTVTKLTDASVLDGFPEHPPSALLETHKFGTYENFQYFKATNKVYYRRWLDGNDWDVWRVESENLNLYAPDSLPPANSSNRGRMVFVYRGGSGEEDEVVVCMRADDGQFKWKSISFT